MRPLEHDWKAEALDSVCAALDLPEELDAWLDRLIESGNWEWSTLERMMKFVHPTLDLASLENGISASQLGSLLGQVRVLLNQIDSIAVVMNGRLERLQTNADRVKELARNSSEELSEEEQGRVDQLLEFASAVCESVNSFGGFGEELAEIKVTLTDAIDKVVKTATDQTGAEVAGFMSAFGKAWASPSIDDQGRIVTGNPLTVNVTAILAVLGPAMKEHLSSLTEVHRLLARALPNQLTRDENSLQWLEQRKAIEAICRSHGFKLRGRGRPKKGNPKTQ